MENNLNVLLTQTRDRKPLASVCNMPGCDADMTPQQLRALAAALRTAADECEAQPMSPKQFMQRKRAYSLAA
ncbi:MAG: hypothetical protein WC236_00025 [Gallionellaceae bacterium]|jgi:hypothetical protein